MDDQRSHACPVRALCRRRTSAIIVWVVQYEPICEPLMIGDRYAIQQRGDRVSFRSGLVRGRRWLTRLFRLTDGGERLRAQVHDVVEPRERDAGMVDKLPHSVRRQVDQNARGIGSARSPKTTRLWPPSSASCPSTPPIALAPTFRTLVIPKLNFKSDRIVGSLRNTRSRQYSSVSGRMRSCGPHARKSLSISNSVPHGAKPQGIT